MDLGSLEAKEGDKEPATPEAAPTAAKATSWDALGNPLKCYKCDGDGHRQADCPRRPGVEIQCNKCQGWGHYAAECPSKKRKATARMEERARAKKIGAKEEIGAKEAM